ncbi:hypothetical protein NDU88_008176 [Pleurodeles waltl]|uniref:Uncharacterized protein n=1 Tax=Pleurodeles waltl TaxID=8319 RepID=A0AAV7VVL8_PLEWA|nr:hypothetical protein NDU88_008176 [Pleurodeles waltl]
MEPLPGDAHPGLVNPECWAPRRRRPEESPEPRPPVLSEPGTLEDGCQGRGLWTTGGRDGGWTDRPVTAQCWVPCHAC